MFEEALQESIKTALNNALASELQRLSDNIEDFTNRILSVNEDLELMTVKEVAKKMKCSISTVYDLIESGELRAFEVGRLKVTVEDYNNFINKRRRGE